MVGSNDFSFSNPELFINPYPVYQKIREEEPIKFTRMYGGAWVFFKFEDVDYLLKDSRVTNDRSSLPVKALPEGQREPFNEFTELLSKWVAFHEGDEHLVRRRSLNHAFKGMTPEKVKEITEETADYLLSPFGRGKEINLVSEYAEPLSSLVLAQFVGAPKEDHRKIDMWARDLSYLFAASNITSQHISNAWRSAISMMKYFEELFESNEPLSDASILGRLKNGGSTYYNFSVEEACAQCVLLFFAALEPSRDIIGNAILALDDYPDQRRLLQSQPEHWGNAVDEFLRFDPPVQYIGRMAAETFNYRGHNIKKVR
jgi:cytochrome P450